MTYLFRLIFISSFCLIFVFFSALLLNRVEAANSNCVVTEVGNASAKPQLPPQCDDAAGGVGSAGGFVFPLKITKSVITKGSDGMVWCFKSMTNCHHDYNAADIFAPTGTLVIAAVGGRVATAHATSSVGHTAAIVGNDNVLYYYAHMGALRVSAGQNVKAGDPVGLVGTRADAMGTPTHLHFDNLPGAKSRPSCSGAACASIGTINVQPKLVPAFQQLPN